MKRIRKLVTEVHRRSLWQVLGIYALTSWVIYQVVLALYEGIGLPHWVPGTALVLLLIGLPVVLATAFVQEGRPGLGGRSDGQGTSVAGLETTADAVRAPDRRAKEAGSLRDDQAAEEEAAGLPSSMGPATTGQPSFLSWSRAITGGVLAFAALGIAASGFMGMRALGIGPAATLMSAGVLAERDQIVLADFSAPDDSALGSLVTEALRIDLVESPVVALATPEQVAGTRRLIEPDGSGPLTLDRAREVAIRDGLKAVLAGEARRLAGSYVLTAQLVTADSARPLAAFRSTAADSSSLLAAIDELSKEIRSKVGEPLRSVYAAAPLERVTTSSLDALRAYIAGRYQEAVEIDPLFAAAWRKLGNNLDRDGLNRERVIDAVTRAYQLRDRVNPLERALITGTYHLNVTGDWAAAGAAYRAEIDQYPNSHRLPNNLAVVYQLQDQPELAVPLAVRALAADSADGFYWANLAIIQYLAGDREGARETLRNAPRHVRHRGWDLRESARLAAAEGHYDRSDSLAAELREAFEAELSWGNYFALELESHTLAARGRLREARAKFASLDDVIRRSDQDWSASQRVEFAALAALTRLHTLGPAAGIGPLDEILDEVTLDSIPRLDRPYGYLAEVYAAAGRTEEAEVWIARFEAIEEEFGRTYSDEVRPFIARAKALLAIRRGEPERALDILHVAMRDLTYSDETYLALVGRVHETAGRPDSAIAAYRAFLEEPVTARHNSDARDLAFVLERLAELHEQAGRRSEAVRHYRRFIDLWGDADADLQPRVEAARRALARLAAEAG